MGKSAFIPTGDSEVSTGQELELTAESEAARFRGSSHLTASLHHRGGSPSEQANKNINMSLSPGSNRKGGIGTALLGDRLSDEYWLEEGRRRRTQLGNDAAFWLLGLINNSGYVIMMAVAKEIAPGAVGIVFLADVAPTMIIKVTAPYW